LQTTSNVGTDERNSSLKPKGVGAGKEPALRCVKNSEKEGGDRGTKSKPHPKRRKHKVLTKTHTKRARALSEMREEKEFKGTKAKGG